MTPCTYVLALLPLLSAGVVVTQRGDSTLASNSTACDCVPWQDAYHKHGAQCGEGHELDSASPIPSILSRNIPVVANEFCQQFFGNLPNEGFCIRKTIFGSSPDDQWCYVSRDCDPKPRALFAKARTVQQRTGLKKKACNANQDKALSRLNFETFAGFAFKSKLELGLAVQFTYPKIEGAVLPDVLPFWGLKAPVWLLENNRSMGPLTDAVRRRLRAQQESGKPALIPSPSGHPPFAVVEGKKLYWVNFNEKTKAMLKEGGDIFEKVSRESMNSWKCVAGCWFNSVPF